MLFSPRLFFTLIKEFIVQISITHYSLALLTF